MSKDELFPYISFLTLCILFLKLFLKRTTKTLEFELHVYEQKIQCIPKADKYIFLINIKLSMF